jgi:polyisoprenoid-binding protein YceI
MIKQKLEVFVRVTFLGVCIGLIGFVSACAALGGAEQPNTTAPTTTTVASPAMQPTPTSTSATATGNLQTVRLELVPGDNEVRYRVREQLARISFPTDAVGSTKAVTGTIVANSDGSIVSAESKFQVDLSTLKSDENQRDNFIKMNTLQTNRYQYAVFVPTKVEGLTLPPPTSGDVAFKLIGDLTIRGVTKQVTWDVTGTVNGNEAKGMATTSFTFDYFNLSKPNVFTVLSVEDTIKLEMDIHLKQVAAQ